MFKAVQRNAAFNILIEFIAYYEQNEDQHPMIRRYLALVFRNFIREVQPRILDVTSDEDELSCAIRFVAFVVPKPVAAEICMDVLKNAKTVPDFLDDSSLYQCSKFTSGFFRMVHISPTPDIAEQKALFGNADKNFALFEKYHNVLFNLFKDHSEMLLTDMVQKDAISAGLGF